MIRLAVILVAVAGLALAACNRAEMTDEQFNRMVVENGGASEPPPAPGSAQAFANAMANTNKYVIALAQIADVNSSASPATKSFATTMIADHKLCMDKLRVALAHLDPPPMADGKLSDDQKAMFDVLRPKRGAEFDAAFKAMQVDAHQRAMKAVREYADSGDTPVLVQFARAMEPEMADHLEQARALPGTSGGVPSAE